MIVVVGAYISGTRDGQPWPAAGDTIEVPDGEGQDLVDAGLATEEV